MRVGRGEGERALRRRGDGDLERGGFWGGLTWRSSGCELCRASEPLLPEDLRDLSEPDEDDDDEEDEREEAEEDEEDEEDEELLEELRLDSSELDLFLFPAFLSLSRLFLSDSSLDDRDRAMAASELTLPGSNF